MSVDVYTVDRADNPRLRHRVTLSESDQTVWHRARPDDRGLAACSRRIVLNTEDRSPSDAKWVGPLCRRCFPAGLSSTEPGDPAAR